jgi:hypothetical protein
MAFFLRGNRGYSGFIVVKRGELVVASPLA